MLPTLSPYELMAAWGLPTSTHVVVVDTVEEVLARIAYVGEHRHSVEHEEEPPHIRRRRRRRTKGCLYGDRSGGAR